MIKKILLAILLLPTLLYAQINTERVMTIARNALYFEDYVLSIQYFNQVINAIALPMPRAAPVTMAVFPSNNPILFLIID